MKRFMTVKPEIVEGVSNQEIKDFCKKHNIAGVEEFGDDLLPRNEKLDPGNLALQQQLLERGCLRLHCSYWAYPTSFLAGRNSNELFSRMGGPDEVAAYYGDLTGDTMIQRWVDEYRLATAIGAEAYVFHLIDYAPIDGRWEFTLTREVIADAMITITQRLMNSLLAQGAVDETTPLIELENAGWGLEFGTQTPADYLTLFNEIYDPFNRLRICWDLNHLLHAVNVDSDGSASFALEPFEIDSGMRALAHRATENPKFDLMDEWLRFCLLDPQTRGRIGSISISDCNRRDADYFRNGLLREPELSTLRALTTVEAQEDYGVRIVLEHYDSHLPLGTGVLNPEKVGKILQQLLEVNPNVVVLHELKNSHEVFADTAAQIDLLEKVMA